MLGGELLPETRPAITAHSAVGGASGLVRYAFNDRLTLQAKGWWTTDNSWRSGLACSAIVPFGDTNANIRFGAMLTTAFAASKEGYSGDWGIMGTGFGLSALVWIPLEPRTFTLYGALGPAYGVRNTRYDGYGYGAILNLGFAYTIVSSLTANLEGSAILARDVYDAKTNLMISPALEVGWEF
jgi:hypothetical protein